MRDGELDDRSAGAVRAPKRRHWERNWKIFWDAIDEDFALAASMQAGLASGANAALTFGTNEFACDLFERAVDDLVDVPSRGTSPA